jgi:hypothetical protein
VSDEREIEGRDPKPAPTGEPYWDAIGMPGINWFTAMLFALSVVGLALAVGLSQR